MRGLRPGLHPYLVTDNSTALLVDGGLSVFVPQPIFDEFGVQQFREIVVSNLRGDVTLTTYTLVLLAVGSWLFRRPTCTDLQPRGSR